MDEFKKHQLKLVDEDNAPKGDSYSILKCFVFDTSLPNGAGTYHLNSLEILKMEDAARVKLDALVDDVEISEGEKTVFKAPLADQKYSVVFGIVTHKDKGKKSLNLPLFSRISLMRNLKSFQLMSIPAAYGFVEDQSQKNAGKKKKRKARNKAAQA